MSIFYIFIVIVPTAIDVKCLLNWSLVIGYWLLVIGYWLLVIGYWLLVIGHLLLVIGYWLFTMTRDATAIANLLGIRRGKKQILHYMGSHFDRKIDSAMQIFQKDQQISV